MASLHGITVQYALSLDCLKGSMVVGGKDGLGRLITGVNVMEVPDILPWVQEGQLLLTTGFSIKDNQEAQEKLIPELARRGLAGLAFKPKRYLDAVPAAMIAAADVSSFPLIELPPEANHPGMLQGIYSELVNRQVSLLKKTVEVHEKAMAVLLKGGGLEQIASTLAQLVDNPVAIYDQERVALTVAFGDTEQRHSGCPDNLPAPDSLDKGRIKWEKFTVNQEQYRGVLCPIIGGSTTYGLIAVWEQKRPLRDIDLIAVEQAATLAAMTFLHRKTVQAVETKYRNELLYDWLGGEVEQVEELIHRAKLVGWDLENSFALLVIDIDEYGQVVSKARRIADSLLKVKEKVQRAIIRVMDRWRDYFIIGDRGSSFVLLVRVKASWSDRSIKERAREVASLLHAELGQAVPKLSCSIGIGRFYPNLLDMKESYREARQAIDIGRSVKGKGEITGFEDLGIYRLLHSSTSNELKQFAREIFVPIQAYDREHHTELVPTIETFFRCNGNLSRMAREMFTHYNTIVYRLERVQEITGVDLNDTEQRLNLQVAMKVAQMDGLRNG